MSASVADLVGPNGKTPALLTGVATWPPRRGVAWWASSRTESPSPRSAAMKSALPPAARIVATTASPRAASRPLTRTCAPRRASSRAAERPMPLVAPVTSAVLPVRSVVLMVVLSLLSVGCAIHFGKRKLGCPIQFAVGFRHGRERHRAAPDTQGTRDAAADRRRGRRADVRERGSGDHA